MKDEIALLKGTHTLWIGIELSICALTPDLWDGDGTCNGRHCSLCIYGYLFKVQDASYGRSQEGELLKSLPGAPSNYSVPVLICFKPGNEQILFTYSDVNVNGSWWELKALAVENRKLQLNAQIISLFWYPPLGEPRQRSCASPRHQWPEPGQCRSVWESTGPEFLAAWPLST